MFIRGLSGPDGQGVPFISTTTKELARDNTGIGGRTEAVLSTAYRSMISIYIYMYMGVSRNRGLSRSPHPPRCKPLSRALCY